jgi:hypothetical protein
MIIGGLALIGRCQCGLFEPTLAKASPLSRTIHVPPCTADLSPQTRVKVSFLLYVEGGEPYFFNAQIDHYFIISDAGSFVSTAHAGT